MIMRSKRSNEPRLQRETGRERNQQMTTAAAAGRAMIAGDGRFAACRVGPAPVGPSH